MILGIGGGKGQQGIPACRFAQAQIGKLQTISIQPAYPAMTRDQLKPIVRDPKIRALPYRFHPWQVKKRRHWPQERQPPGYPAKRFEAVIDFVAMRRNQVHLF